MYRGFEERNPNLKLIGAYIHMDEASPHLHLDYVPVAHGYSRSLRPGTPGQSHEADGLSAREREPKEQRHEALEESERAVFGEICRGLGLEVEPERKSDRKSLTVEEYKDARDEMLGDIEQEKEAIVAEVEPLRELKTGIDEIAGTGKTVLPGVVAIKKKDLEAVKEQAKAYTANRDEIETLRERSAAVSQRGAACRSASSSSSVKQVWKICRTKSLRGTIVSSVSISFWRKQRETEK